MVAAALARAVGAGVVPVRKAGKLPPPTVSARYELEYGSAEIEVPTGVAAGPRVYVVDDVLATGGTLAASVELLTRAGAQVSGVGVLIELEFRRPGPAGGPTSDPAATLIAAARRRLRCRIRRAQVSNRPRTCLDWTW